MLGVSNEVNTFQGGNVIYFFVKTGLKVPKVHLLCIGFVSNDLLLDFKAISSNFLYLLKKHII